MFNMIHRKTPCDVCGAEMVKVNQSTQLFMNGAEDLIYEEKCVQCGNLLYGWVKRTKDGELVPIRKLEGIFNGRK